MIKYFGGHTEISFSKTMRGTYDHQGLSESRVASHNSHFGMRDINKKNLNIFPFKWVSMSSAHTPRLRDARAAAHARAASCAPLLSLSPAAHRPPPRSPGALRRHHR